ncbi:DNA helicase [Clostridia bacterium]|nr:DNA helicase [Clostridia bacterium]
MSEVWTLEYDGGLSLRFPVESTETLLSSAFFKLSLKRYAADVTEGIIRFKDALTYLDYKKIISLCEKETAKRCVTLAVTDSLTEVIQKKELYIHARSRLGVELKNRDKKLIPRFEEYKSIVDGAMVRPLRDKQMWDSFFICVMQKSGNFSVPGSGKTASVLGMYAYLKSKDLVRRIVVVCPKSAFGSWIDEFGFCFGEKEELRLFNLHTPEYNATQARRLALKYESGGRNLILINYESIGTYRNEIQALIDAQTLLVFDEIHRVKRVGGEYAQNAVAIAKAASYVVAMTGTPIPNTYTDIYNFLHILFPDEYDEFFRFDLRMLRNPTQGDVREVNDKLQPFFCRTTKQQLLVPEANADEILSLKASETEGRLFEILRRKYIRNRLTLMLRLLQLETNPALLLNKLDLCDFRYILDDSAEVNEIDFVDYSEDMKNLIASCGTPTKFSRCVDLVKSLAAQDKPVIVWCIFIDSITRLGQAFEKSGVKTMCITGNVPLEDRQRILSQFKNGEFTVLLTNPHTLAESVSLHSVCHDAVYYEYSYNLVHLLQSKDRIHRLGLSPEQYTQYYFLQNVYDTAGGDWSLDEQIYLRLIEKEQTMLRAIDNNELESMPTSDEDLERIFMRLV